MQSIADAWRIMETGFPVLDGERVSLDQALGRNLSEGLRARHAAPAFSNSAMDGYAVRAEDVVPGQAMRVGGESRAGGDAPGPHAGGTATRIFTGAPMPEGADAVIAQEDARRDGEHVVFTSETTAGKFVRRAGSAIAEGAPLAESGDRMHPGLLGLLASQGIASVTVHRRPRVAIVVSGDELREPGEPLSPGSVFDANGPILAALVREAGGIPNLLPRVGDDEAALRERLKEALGADVVVTSGGASVGDYDLLPAVLGQVGVERRLWKIAIKPGKPVLFGQAGDTPVLSLPGNPVSAYVTGQLFLVPGLRRMQGEKAPFPAPVTVRLDRSIRHRPGRQQWFRARLRWDGHWVATPHANQGSGAMPSIGEAEVLIPLGAEEESLGEGSRVQAWPLRMPGWSRPLWECLD